MGQNTVRGGKGEECGFVGTMCDGEAGEGALRKWALSSKLKFTGVKLQEEGGRISVSEGPTVRNDRASSDSRIIYLAYPVH